MSRRDEHASDQEEFPNKHVCQKGTTEGGACLTGHESGRQSTPPGYLKENSCNYRWQAFMQALNEPGIYNGKALEGSRISMLVFGRKGAKGTVQPSSKTVWDVTADGVNFRTACNTPYWHEGHHIVAHGELRDSIEQVGKGEEAAVYRRVIRQGLLDEKYNLNHKPNLIILPMDETIAKTIGLPRHRKTPAHRSHKAYSAFIRGKLDEIFKSIRQQESAHQKKPEYKACKQQIVNVSQTTRPLIVGAGGLTSLDEAFARRPSTP